ADEPLLVLLVTSRGQHSLVPRQRSRHGVDLGRERARRGSTQGHRSAVAHRDSYLMARERDEEEFLERYRPGDFPRPSVTVDIVVLTIVDAELRVLLIRRKDHPFKNRWALPGGFVRVGDGHRSQGEDLDAAAARELEEETGLAPRMAYLEQLRAFGRAGREPRMRVITMAYYAIVRHDYVPLVRAGGDAAEAEWVAVTSLPRTPLAFDHADIIAAS